MKLLPPPRGSVIRYAYLWADEQRRGREEASKERPALVLTLSVVEQDRSVSVLAVAITHTPPERNADAVALPRPIKRRLGLDDAPSWIVTTEANAFAWPGPDVRPIPGSKPLCFSYGQVPGTLLRRVARSYLENRERQRGAIVRRT